MHPAIEIGLLETAQPARGRCNPTFHRQDRVNDNALAESVIGLYKTEVINRRSAWCSVEAVELATLEWVDWFNRQRLLAPIGYVPPAECEEQYYRRQATPAMPDGVT